MSLKLIDEIYSALHNGEKPPYTNTRGQLITLSMLDSLKKHYEIGEVFFIPYDKDDFDFYEKKPIVD